MKLRFAFILCLLASAGSAWATTTVFTDDFSGSASAGLKGQTTSTGGGTWIASASFNADGSTTGAGSAWLAYDFQAGFIYTLSVDVDSSGLPETSSGAYAGIAFTTDADNTGAFGKTTPHHGVLVLRNYKSGGSTASSTFYPTSDPATNYTPATNWTSNSTSATLTFILDTTGTNWTYQVNDGTTTKNGNLTKADLTGLGLVASDAGAKFANLSFSAVQASIPEPSAYALCSALSAILLTLSIRRRRSLRG